MTQNSYSPDDLLELGLAPDHLDNLQNFSPLPEYKDSQKQLDKLEKDIKVRDEEKPTYDTVALYLQGLERLQQAGYLLQANPESKLAGHNIYVSANPDPVQGIEYPQGFRFWQRVTELDTLSKIYGIASDWGNTPTTKLFTKSLQPQLKTNELTPLQSLASFVLRMETEKYKAGNHTFNLGLNPCCQGMPLARGKDTDYLDASYEPVSFLPPLEWFSDSVRQLKLSDIITILPPDELAMFSLAFGRGLVGRSNHLPPGSDEPIKHFARMALLIQGDAGIGKSATLDRGLLRVIKSLGYKVCTSYDLDGKYNDMEVFQSNIAYLDDTNISQLTRLASSHITKMVITNSTVKYEQKYVPSGVVPCHTFLCICLNELDEYVVFKMDEGNADRLKLVTCYTKQQMETTPLEVLGKTYPTRSPDVYIPMLAKDLDVSPDAIWLWACRLMADDFYASIPDLYEVVKERTMNLAFTWMKAVVPGVMSCLYVANRLAMLEAFNGGIPEEKQNLPLSRMRADNSLHNLLKLMENVDLIYSMHEDFEENPSEEHPYNWIKRIHKNSVSAAGTSTTQVSKPMNTGVPWETALRDIELLTGFSFAPKHHRIVQGWDKALANRQSLDRVSDLLYKEMTKNRKRAEKAGIKIDDLFKNPVE